MGDKVTIKIPRELPQRLRRMTVVAGFSIVTEFLVFVMLTLASGGEIREEDRLTAEDVRATKERLRRPGYLEEEE